MKYTKQPVPIYRFCLDEKGTLIRKSLYEYDKLNTPGYGGVVCTYRIHVDSTLVTKTNLQIDRWLNNSIYTFNPSMNSAKAKAMEALDLAASAALVKLESAKFKMARLAGQTFTD